MLSERIYREILERTLVLLEGLEDDRKRLMSYFDQTNDADVYTKLKRANPPVIRWLSKNITNKKTMIDGHTAADVIQTVVNFDEIANTITAKWKRREEPLYAGMKFIDLVRKRYEDANIQPSWKKPPIDWENSSTWVSSPVPDWSNLKLKEIEILSSANQVKKSKNKIAESGYVPKTFIAKIGPWNIWVPDTKKDSIEIQGYDRATLRQHTTWCTGRLDGSNLFYGYSVGSKYLIYIIKDDPIPFPNPRGEWDYISIGVNNGVINLNGRYGGDSVNRDNNPLTPEKLKEVFSEYNDQIIDTVRKYASENIMSKSAIVFLEAMKDIEKLKDMLSSLSKKEKADTIRDLLHNVPEEVYKPKIDVCLYLLGCLGFLKNGKVDVSKMYERDHYRLFKIIPEEMLDFENMENSERVQYLDVSPVLDAEYVNNLSNIDMITYGTKISIQKMKLLNGISSRDLSEACKTLSKKISKAEMKSNNDSFKRKSQEILEQLKSLISALTEIYEKINVKNNQEWLDLLDFMIKNKALDTPDGAHFLCSKFLSPVHFIECLELVSSNKSLISAIKVLEVVNLLPEDYLNLQGSIEKIFKEFNAINKFGNHLNILEIAKKLKSIDRLTQLLIELNEKNCDSKEAESLVSSIRKTGSMDVVEKKLNEKKWALKNRNFLESIGISIESLDVELDDILDDLEI